MEPEVVMERRKFTREFKLEAVKLSKERGVGYVQAARDLGVHQSVLRNWVKGFAADPQHSFPGHGHMKPEQLEIAQLKREVTKLKAERDILKKPVPTSRRNRHEVRLHREAPGDLAGGMVGGARCLAGWLLCLADTAAECAKEMRRGCRRRCGQASLRAIEPMARGVCGATCWRKGCHADCIGSSG
jgi:transposase